MSNAGEVGVRTGVVGVGVGAGVAKGATSVSLITLKVCLLTK